MACNFPCCNCCPPYDNASHIEWDVDLTAIDIANAVCLSCTDLKKVIACKFQGVDAGIHRCGWAPSFTNIQPACDANVDPFKACLLNGGYFVVGGCFWFCGVFITSHPCKMEVDAGILQNGIGGPGINFFHSIAKYTLTDPVNLQWPNYKQVRLDRVSIDQTTWGWQNMWCTANPPGQIGQPPCTGQMNWPQQITVTPVTI